MERGGFLLPGSEGFEEVVDEADEGEGLAVGGVDAVADVGQVDMCAVRELARRPLGVGVDQGSAEGGIALQKKKAAYDMLEERVEVATFFRSIFHDEGQ